MTTPPPRQTWFNRRRFLAAASAGICSPLLLNCRQSTAQANAVSEATALHVADFRQRGLGDREVLRRAFEAWASRGGTLHLEPGRRYELGYHADGSNVFEISGMRDATLAGNGATLAIHTRQNARYNFFYLHSFRGLRIENLAAVDTGYSGAIASGALFIVLDAGSTESVDLTLDNVAGDRFVSFLQMQGVPGGARVRRVRILPNCRASRSFYGLACLNQGDDVSGGLRTFNCGRSYFPYGVSNHDLRLEIHHEGAGSGPVAETAILIKSYDRPTSGIRVDATFSGVLAANGSCVTLEHQGDPAGPPSVIEDVDIRLRIAPGTRDPHGAHRVAFRTFDPQDREIVGRTRNIWRRIRIGGELSPEAAPAIFSRSLPASPPDILIAPGTSGIGRGQFAAPGFRFRTQ